MSFDLQQIWYHLEDFRSPSEVQMIRQVMDIYTLDNIIEIDFGGTEKYHQLKELSLN